MNDRERVLHQIAEHYQLYCHSLVDGTPVAPSTLSDRIGQKEFHVACNPNDPHSYPDTIAARKIYDICAARYKRAKAIKQRTHDWYRVMQSRLDQIGIGRQ